MTTDRERLDAILSTPRAFFDDNTKWLLDRAEEAIASHDRITALEAEVERLRDEPPEDARLIAMRAAQDARAAAEAERDALAQRVTALEAEVERALARIAEPYRTLGEERDAARAERDALAQRVAAVRALHREYRPLGDPESFAACVECGASWPCPTVAALDGVTVPDDPRIAKVRALCEGMDHLGLQRVAVMTADVLAILDGEATP